MKKVLLAITSLEIGGAERVLVDVANNLSNNFDITIFTIYNDGFLLDELNKKITKQSMFKKSMASYNKFQKKLISLLIISPLKFYWHLKYFKKYDLKIAFLEGPVTYLLAGLKPSLAFIHTNLKEHPKHKLLEKYFYKKYQKLVFVSNDAKKSFYEIYPIKNEGIVIYNSLDVKRILRQSKEEINTKFDKDVINLIVVARLVPAKAIDRLIRIHNRLIRKGLKHHIYVIGDGPEKDFLNDLIRNYQVADTFHLLGSKANPYPYIKEANALLLPSKYEGYGMVLREAMVLNKPILLTNTGAVEAAADYPYKVIMENNEEDIYQALKIYLSYPATVKKYQYKENNLKALEDLWKEMM